MTVDGIGPIMIMRGEDQLYPGELEAGYVYEAVYDGSAFQLKVRSLVRGVPYVTFRGVVDHGDAAPAMEIDWTQGNIHRFRSVSAETVNLSFIDPLGPARLVLQLLASNDGGTGMVIVWPSNVTLVGDTAVNQDFDHADIVELLFDGSDYYAKIYEAFT